MLTTADDGSAPILADSTSADAKFMNIAIAEALKSIPVEAAYCVGAVLVSSSGSVLSTGYSRELPGNTHAEQCALAKLSDISLAKGGTMYSTMEPCSVRLSGNPPCAQSLVAAGVARVVVGVMEPPDLVVCDGVRILSDGGIKVDRINGFEERCLAPNAHILAASKEKDLRHSTHR
ncbi:DRAP deaminase [Gonapodya sp. JEL0774]|nr:DRAP deaminase [Gonapodya sp. JEL0774]